MVEENKISLLYMGLILSSLMIIGLVTFQGEFMTNYGTTVDDLEYLEKSSDVAKQITDMKESIESTRPTGIDVLDSFIAGTYNTLKLLFGIGDLYTTFITSIAVVMGIPGWFVNGVLLAIFTVIIFGVISTIAKWKT